jgi:sugar phosphate isomerase/epimerase
MAVERTTGDGRNAGGRCSRRCFLGTLAGALAATPLWAATAPFQFRWLISSSLYGTTPLEQLLPELRTFGAAHLDIWPRVHGSQREQAEEMGREKFAALLKRHGVGLACSTRYDLGPFKLQDEMKFVKALGGSLIVTGSGGPKGLRGMELKAAIKSWAEKMKPHLDAAEDAGLSLAIENHAASLIESPDSIRWILDEVKSLRLGLALAPYHLPQEPGLIAQLIADAGPRLLVFYAWQHGRGSAKAQPKADELLQLPGRGPLDFRPVVAALRRINYSGWTVPFMHPFPRGLAIMPTVAESTAELLRARAHLEGFLK